MKEKASTFYTMDDFRAEGYNQNGGIATPKDLAELNEYNAIIEASGSKRDFSIPQSPLIGRRFMPFVYTGRQ